MQWRRDCHVVASLAAGVLLAMTCFFNISFPL